MDEMITKKQAIEVISKANGVLYWNNTLKSSLIKLINEIPSAQSESFEWCTDCKEYDQEAHCCHRWSKMIRKTVDEMQIVRCKDCKHFIRDDIEEYTPYGFYNTYFHAFCDKHWDREQGEYIDVNLDDYCSFAERREDG